MYETTCMIIIYVYISYDSMSDILSITLSLHDIWIVFGCYLNVIFPRCYLDVIWI